MQSTKLDLTADMIDVRDVIARFEELERDSAEWADNGDDADAWQELNTLQALLDELKGYGGDEQWRGDWYPSQLIDDCYFTEYTIQLLEDCGDLPRNLPDYIAVDWERTARNIRVDYSAVEVYGRTYWYR